MFIASAKRIIETMQPVMIPTSNLCHSDVAESAETLRLKSLLIVQDKLSYSSRNMVALQHLEDQLTGH